MNIQNIIIVALLPLFACSSEVVVDDARPSEHNDQPPRQIERPSQRNPAPAATSGMGRRSGRELGNDAVCVPGEAWRCTFDDGTCGVQICIDGESFTECSKESPVPLEPAPDDSE